ncbi:hypothetical protein [Mycobacteroides abscessus]|uniref:hypothetical protein n=1 Tax=Mycobacteroides abscessus TaxID=36809 RepID=UPI0009258FDA|nr:hypothetical protein [Mycobacteroides abscessus]SIC59435.1 Uncharacterised protein [Mycobacteroides abscessus subsp. abscessus]
MTGADMSLWDFKFHTSDRNFSGMGVVQAPSEREARAEVKKTILQNRPDVEIKEIVIRPTIGVNNMARAIKAAGLSSEAPKP